MQIPEGVQSDNKIRKTTILNVSKALYVLEVSPKIWNKRFKEEMTKLGPESSISEPCLFTTQKKNKFVENYYVCNRK